MAKVGDILNAIEAYKALSPVGKRLFREEVGVIRPQQGKARRRRKVSELPETPPAKVLRTARRLSSTTIEIPAATV